MVEEYIGFGVLLKDSPQISEMHIFQDGDIAKFLSQITFHFDLIAIIGSRVVKIMG